VDDDGSPYRWIARPDRVSIARSDTFADLGMFRPSYEPHNFGAALVDNVSHIVDDDLSGELGISSAGLLKNGAVAWVEISIPETMSTASGFEYRPNLVAATSCDGSLATTYKRTITATVCDNTLNAALGERGGQTYKIRHTRNSGFKIANAREALGIIFQTSEEFAAEVDRLCGIAVNDEQWDLVLKEIIPAGDTKRGTTRADNRRNEVSNLWQYDNRVAPWSGTAFGVVQAFNTYRHHVSQVNSGTVRSERNMQFTLDGTTDKEDATVLAALTKVGVLA
jgi:phage/plasmid-like protein (TIGR03299 family)